MQEIRTKTKCSPTLIHIQTCRKASSEDVKTKTTNEDATVKNLAPEWAFRAESMCAIGSTALTWPVALTSRCARHASRSVLVREKIYNIAITGAKWCKNTSGSSAHLRTAIVEKSRPSPPAHTSTVRVEHDGAPTQSLLSSTDTLKAGRSLPIVGTAVF